jgi:hypothetical protein
MPCWVEELEGEASDHSTCTVPPMAKEVQVRLEEFSQYIANREGLLLGIFRHDRALGMQAKGNSSVGQNLSNGRAP